MRLLSFGCSFIFGNELADDGRDGLWATASQLTWPAHLARELGRSYHCHARAGSGNLQIMEQILDQATNSDSEDFFVVGWSWTDRFDYYPATPTDLSRSPWRTIMPIDDNKVAEVYYKYLHSEYRDKLTNLVYVKTAIDALTQRRIPFVMTYMDSLMFDQQWHTTQATSQLQQQIVPHMTTFEGQNFLDWSRSHNYPVTELWHPLEQAHQAAAQYIFDILNRNPK
jgi:phospholipase/lecithinase/hemolysin